MHGKKGPKGQSLDTINILLIFITVIQDKTKLVIR